MLLEMKNVLKLAQLVSDQMVFHLIFAEIAQSVNQVVQLASLEKKMEFKSV